jgi:hypothetical protein
MRSLQYLTVGGFHIPKAWHEVIQDDNELLEFVWRRLGDLISH